MTKQMKPPPRRRSSGRVLGAGKTAASSAPPSAELTREQLAAEQAAYTETAGDAADPDGTQPASEPQQSQEPSNSQPPRERAAEVAPTETETDPSPPHKAPAPAVASAPQVEAPVDEAEPSPEQLPATQTSAPVDPSPSAEVAVRSAQFTGETGGPFPSASGQSGSQHEPADSPHAGSEPWAQGPGRPKDMPSAAAVLNQRTITRESLDASVASALRLKRRLKRFALDNELDHLPLGDIVTVALDDWLTERGY